MTNETAKGYNSPGPLAVVILLAIPPVPFVPPVSPVPFVDPGTAKNDTMYGVSLC